MQFAFSFSSVRHDDIATQWLFKERTILHDFILLCLYFDSFLFIISGTDREILPKLYVTIIFSLRYIFIKAPPPTPPGCIQNQHISKETAF